MTLVIIELIVDSVAKPKSGRALRATTRPDELFLDNLLGPLPTLRVDRETRKQLKRLVPWTWFISLKTTLGSVSGEKASKRRPFSAKSKIQLQRLAEQGSDEALCELVYRDRSYLFTDLARAKVALWMVQRKLVSLQEKHDDQGASEKLLQLGKSVSRTVFEKVWQIDAFERAIADATKRVDEAATYVSTHRTREDTHLREKFGIAQPVVDILYRQRARPRAKNHTTAIDIQTGQLLGLRVDRVGQLRRELDRRRAEGWLEPWEEA